MGKWCIVIEYFSGINIYGKGGCYVLLENRLFIICFVCDAILKISFYNFLFYIYRFVFVDGILEM